MQRSCPVRQNAANPGSERRGDCAVGQFCAVPDRFWPSEATMLRILLHCGSEPIARYLPHASARLRSAASSAVTLFGLALPHVESTTP